MNSCPLDLPDTEIITLAHGEGGKLSRDLLAGMILPLLGVEDPVNDAADCSPVSGDSAITSDSFVVSPLFFPGGDIGSLAVLGTVNDLAVSGASTNLMTVALMIEEGLERTVLAQVLRSVAQTARDNGVRIVGGDTKVLPRGAMDKLFINTTGIGTYDPFPRLSPARIMVGDQLIVSGPIGCHGMSVMAARNDFRVHPTPRSDCRSLRRACHKLHAALGDGLRAMRDATRGGIAAVLHEWSGQAGITVCIDDTRVPVPAEVKSLSELLGIDPIHVANEGTFVAAVAADRAAEAVAVLQTLAETCDATIIGEVLPRQSVGAIRRGLLGVLQPIDSPAGSPLPRIC